MSIDLKACPFCGCEPDLSITKLGCWCSNRKCHLWSIQLPPSFWNTRHEAAKVPEQPVEETDIETFLVRLGRPHIKTAFRGDGNPTDNQVAREIGSSLIQLHLGLAEKVEDIDAPKRESGCLSQNANKKSCASGSADGEKLQNIGEVAIQHGLIDSPTAFAHRDKIEAALRTISDEGKSDAGIGFGGFDFWIKLHGIEYYFNVKRKITQIEGGKP